MAGRLPPGWWIPLVAYGALYTAGAMLCGYVAGKIFECVF